MTLRPCRILFVIALALVALSVAGRTPARAQSLTCTLAAPALAFGTINVLSGSPAYASGNVTVSCVSTYPVAFSGYACLSIGSGSGGGSASARTLASGSSVLPFELRETAGASAQIGDGTSNPQEGPVSLTIPANGTATASFPVTGIIRTQPSLPLPGTYVSTFSGTQFEAVGSITPSTTCAQVDATTAAAFTGSLTATATVPNQCSVSATAMAFPTSSLLNVALQATASVTVTCNATATAVVGLDNGGYGTGPTARQMASGTNRVTYGIYADAAHSVPWGNSAGNTQTLALTGASSKSVTAYGLVPVQAGKLPGSYADVVNVTVSY